MKRSLAALVLIALVACAKSSSGTTRSPSVTLALESPSPSPSPPPTTASSPVPPPTESALCVTVFNMITTSEAEGWAHHATRHVKAELQHFLAQVQRRSASFGNPGDVGTLISDIKDALLLAGVPPTGNAIEAAVVRALTKDLNEFAGTFC